MPSKAVSYGIAALLAVLGVPLMSYAAAQLDKLKTKAEKDKSPWIAGVVFGVLLIVAGIGYAAFTFMSGDAVAPATMPTEAAGSASAVSQNPIVAIENAARAKKNAAEHAANNAQQIEKAAKALNAVIKSSET